MSSVHGLGAPASGSAESSKTEPCEVEVFDVPDSVSTELPSLTGSFGTMRLGNSEPGSASSPATQNVESLSLTQLRQKARATQGISEKRKNEKGKWVGKDRDELLADFQAWHAHGPGSASPGVSTECDELEKLSKAELRTLASQTAGVGAKKKDSAGKWKHKGNKEIILQLRSRQSDASAQSLTGGRCAADKKKAREARKRELKRTEQYKAMRRLNERATTYKFAKNVRRKQDKYKLQKKQYERGSKAKLSRLQRKWARFWAPCLSNWSATRTNVAIRSASIVAVYAPRFYSDGRIAILQHGSVEKVLPSPQKPPRGASKQQVDDFLLALELRCRIGGVSCERGGSSPNTCWQKLDGKAARAARKEEKRMVLMGTPPCKPRRLRLGGCVNARRGRQHSYQSCPLQNLSREALSDMAELRLIDWGEVANDLGPGAPASARDKLLRNMWVELGGDEMEDIIPSLMMCDVALPDPTILKSHLQACEDNVSLLRECKSPPLQKPSERLREFLCNDQCPKQCCTLYCPWNSMANHSYLHPQKILQIFGQPCQCNSWTCRQCVQDRLLQRYADPHPGSVASSPQQVLESPPPFRLQLYTGTGEPVSDSSAGRCGPKLYRLTCVPWSVRQVGGRLPDWLAVSSFQQLSLPEFLDASGFNTVRNYRTGSMGSYSDYMQPIHDSYTVAPVPVRCYGHAAKYWTPDEARRWNATAAHADENEDFLPDSVSRDVPDNDSGWEWRWEEDEETWTQAHVKFRGQWKVACEAFSVSATACREWVKLADGRVVSTRCSLCTFLYGPPLDNATVVHPGLPEDIAVAGANLLVKLRMILTGIEVSLKPSDVVCMATKFHVIVAGIDDLLVAISREEAAELQALELLIMFEDGCGSPRSSRQVYEDMQPRQDFKGLEADLVEFQRWWRKVYHRRRADTIEGWSIYGKPYKCRPYLAEAASRWDLNLNCTQQLLELADFKAPVFALVGTPDDGRPRLTRGGTGCQCNTPWHHRSLWERQPWVAYELPLPNASEEPGHGVFEQSASAQTAPASGSADPDVNAATHEAGAGVLDGCIKETFANDCPRAASNDLLVWSAEDEEDLSSDAAETQESHEEVEEEEEEEDAEEEEEEEEDDEESELEMEAEEESEESVSLDVDILESGDPGSRPDGPVSASSRSDEPGSPGNCVDLFVEQPSDGAPWGDVRGDNSSDECVSEPAYYNESEM